MAIKTIFHPIHKLWNKYDETCPECTPTNPDYWCTECGRDKDSGGRPSICNDCRGIPRDSVEGLKQRLNKYESELEDAERRINRWESLREDVEIEIRFIKSRIKAKGGGQ